MTTGTLPENRIPLENEKAEDKVNLDKEWAEEQGELKEKLRKDSAFNIYAYRVSSYTVESILKKRTELLKDKENEEAELPAQPPVPFIKPQ